MFVWQVQDLHRKLSEETRRADNLAFDMKKLEEKHETVMKEKEVGQVVKCARKESASLAVLTFFKKCFSTSNATTRGSSSRETL